ncbi:LysE family translocator [Actibacterium sp. 188UL27-1]|uniref:LysE family translocator n=1 Tax=Actibacterium sp. 188UL27-1 TaxID=2786961 RepID=UPI00195EAD8B|nr:LysE family translocator [Actibacterium sp. 188UL27-1]MBM7066463.1 LysE family translocator [Actibacterium sp. 188UL27-1]
MTILPSELALYAVAVVILFLTPGPVWVALIARALSGGFAAAWPLAIGVSLGDILWTVLAIFGISWVTTIYADFLGVLRWGAVVIFLVMGAGLIRNAGHALGQDSRLTRPGLWPGFMAGIAVILGNPKAVLFYMGVLPGFFDLRAITSWDIVAICGVSLTIPLAGNLVLAGFVSRARRLIASPRMVRRINVTSGLLLIGVAGVIAVT